MVAALLAWACAPQSQPVGDSTAPELEVTIAPEIPDLLEKTQSELFAMAKDYPTWVGRGAALAALDDQELLTQYALQCEDMDLARKAVDRLQDPAQVKEVALKAAPWPARLAAVSKLSDPKDIQQVAGEDAHRLVRIAAIRRSQNIDFLLTIANDQGEAGDIRLAAALGLPADLAFAKSCSHPLVRAGATLQLSDPNDLVEMVYDKDALVMGAAVARLAELHPEDDPIWAQAYRHMGRSKVPRELVEAGGDAGFLAHVASHGYTPRIRLAAIAKITDLSVLIDLAMSDDRGRDHTVATPRIAELADMELATRMALGQTEFPLSEKARILAIQRIQDSKSLRALMEKNLPRVLSDAVIGQISDFDWLLELCSSEKTVDAARKRLFAIASVEQMQALLNEHGISWPYGLDKLIQDPDCKQFIARTHPNEKVRGFMAQTIVDQGHLEELLATETYLPARIAILENYADQERLKRLALSDPEPELRAKAASKIEDQEFLFERARSAEDLSDQLAATGGLRDEELLKRLANDHPDSAVRSSAVLGINDPLWLVAWLDRVPFPAMAHPVIAQSQDPFVLGWLVTESYDTNTRELAMAQLIRSGYYEGNVATHSRLHELKFHILSGKQRQILTREQNNRMNRPGQDEPLPATMKNVNRALTFASAVDRIYANLFRTRASRHAINLETSDEKLFQRALHSPTESLMEAATHRIQNPDLHGQLLAETQNPIVARRALGLLKEPSRLAQACAGAGLLPVRRSQEFRAAEQSTGRAITRQLPNQDHPLALSEYLTAITFLPKGAVRENSIREACKEAIRLGDDACLSALADLLPMYGDLTLAKHFASCQHPVLGAVARAWADRNQKSLFLGTQWKTITWGEERQ